MELKTLKDLNLACGEDIDDAVYIDELKAEAIKWVKHWKKYSYNNKADAIMEFFNITEEDLDTLKGIKEKE